MKYVNCKDRGKLRPTKNILLIAVLLLTGLLSACASTDATIGAVVITPTTPATLARATTALPPLPTDTFAPTATSEVPPTVRPVTPPTTLTLLPSATNPPPTPTLSPLPATVSVTTSALSAVPGSSPNLAPVITATAALTTSATPTPITGPSLYKGQILFSNGGDIWTIKPDSVAKSKLTNDGGNFDRQTFPDGFNRNPVWSPDGKQVAFASARDVYNQPHYDSGYEIYVMNADGGGLQRVSQSADAVNTQRLPIAWLSTGQLLIRVVTARKQQLELFVVATHKEYPLPIKDAQFLAYSPDKGRLAYTTIRPGPSPAKTISDLLVVGAGGGTAKNLTKNVEDLNNSISELVWSPEGARLAYIENVGDICGYSHLYLIGADGSGRKQLKEENGLISSVSWSPDGTRLVYGEALCTGETTLKLIDTNGGPGQTLTEGQYPQWNTN